MPKITKAMTEAAGINFNTALYRVTHGYSVEDALSLPTRNKAKVRDARPCPVCGNTTRYVANGACPLKYSHSSLTAL